MFDAVLRKHEPRRGYLPGSGLALVVYSALIGAAVCMASNPQSSRVKPPDMTVTLFTTLRPAPPPPPPPRGAAADVEKTPKKTKPVPRVVPQVLALPTPAVDVVEEEQVDPTPPAETPAAEDTGVAGGVAGGVPGGVAGGIPGGVPGAALGGTSVQVLPFGAGMKRPTMISGEQPTYSAQANAAGVEGKVLVRCVITITGMVEDCQVIKPVPLLTEVVLAALARMRFEPVQYMGRPQAIQYLFTYSFKQP